MHETSHPCARHLKIDAINELCLVHRMGVSPVSAAPLDIQLGLGRLSSIATELMDTLEHH